MSYRAPICVLAACMACAGAGGAFFNEGLDALKRGDSATAERKLRAELQSNPNEVEALSFLGVALDNQERFAEAETMHRRALALSPRSNSILDKYGNHQIVSGDDAGARKTFLQALALNAADGYANLQLAQLALKGKRGAEAMDYLNRLSLAQQMEPDVVIDRMVALNLSGHYSEAAALGEPFRSDADWTAAAGRALAVAGEVTRAQDLLEPAASRFPGSFSVQYSLAFVYDALQRPADSLRLLTQAAKLAPARADVQKSLATAAGNLAQYKASLEAWQRYVQLAPADDSGRRERGFASAHVAQFDAAIADLTWYTGRHPQDADGWYELGIAESAQDPTQGMSSLDKAIQLKPDFALARSARGALHYRKGNSEAALPDLERAVTLDPANPMIQYRLGQVYIALDRLREALPHFRRAAELAPNDYTTQFHYANALADAGQTAESDAILERIRNWPVQAPAPSADLQDTPTK